MLQLDAETRLSITNTIDAVRTNLDANQFVAPSLLLAAVAAEMGLADELADALLQNPSGTRQELLETETLHRRIADLEVQIQDIAAERDAAKRHAALADDALARVRVELVRAQEEAHSAVLDNHQYTPVRSDAASRTDFVAAFTFWRQQAASRRRLRTISQSIRSRRSPSEPRVTGVSTWAERDAALRADAVSVDATSSSSSLSADGPTPSGLPFSTVADLPSDFKASKDSAAIINIISSRLDTTLRRWHRRSLYTAGNWAEWAEWSRPGHTHRDRIEAGRVFLNPTSILLAPNLRSPDVEAAADAWNVYRRTLLILIREALTVGFPWAEILARLSTTLSDPDHGYPRLVNHLTAALEDPLLMDYPLLHADVLFYKLDCSYSSGSRKYDSGSVSVDWEHAVSRQPGEDAVSLAIRVTSACVMKLDDPAVNDVTVWNHPSYAREINERYQLCLHCDIADAARGAANSQLFTLEWFKMKALHESDPVTTPSIKLSCEYLAKTFVSPNEAGTALAAFMECESLPQPAGHQLRLGHQTGHGSRARRDAARAALATHHEEPPPH